MSSSVCMRIIFGWGTTPRGKRTSWRASWGSTPEQVLASPHVLLGAPGQIIETLQERRERYRISYVVFLGADLEAAEPVVSALAGT